MKTLNVPDAMNIKSKAPRKKFTNILLRMVADELGNTPTVCKSYYIHPNILELISTTSINWKDDESDNNNHQLSGSEQYLIKHL